MKWISHFLVSFNLLLIFLGDSVELNQIILFSIIFGVLVDMDQIIGFLNKKPAHHRRTWVQEPFGLLIIGIPLGVFLSFLLGVKYFLLVNVPYSSQIILDYLVIHEVSPLAPFSKKNININLIKFRYFEYYFIGINLLVSFFLLFL